MRKWVSVALYTLFAAAVALASFIWQLPPDLASRWASATLQRYDRRLTCSIASWRWRPPLGVEIHEADIAFGGRPMLHFQQVTISPETGSLLTARRQLTAEAQWAGGQSWTTATWESGTVSRANSRLSELNLAAIPMVSALSGRDITGRLSGVVTFQKPVGRPLSADARLMVSDGSVALRNPVMGRQRVAFDKTQASVNLRFGKVTVATMSLKGRELDMDAAGTLQLNAVVNRSEVAISGTFRLKDSSPSSPSAAPPPGRGTAAAPNPTTIPFTISGTLADPMIRLKAVSPLDSSRQERLESRDRPLSPGPPPEE